MSGDQPPRVPNKDQKHILDKLSGEIHRLHTLRSSLRPDAQILTNPRLEETEKIIEPVLKTWWPHYEEHIRGDYYAGIWRAFEASLLRVWDLNEISGAQQDYWYAVSRVYSTEESEMAREDVEEERRVMKMVEERAVRRRRDGKRPSRRP